jgi:hypothetical protein
MGLKGWVVGKVTVEAMLGNLRDWHDISIASVTTT